MDFIFQTDSIATKVSFAVGAVFLLTTANYLFVAIRNSIALSKFPIANEKWDSEAKKKFTVSAGAILARGAALVSRQSFQDVSFELIFSGGIG
jgi:hypothetical protein